MIPGNGRHCHLRVRQKLVVNFQVGDVTEDVMELMIQNQVTVPFQVQLLQGRWQGIRRRDFHQTVTAQVNQLQEQRAATSHARGRVSDNEMTPCTQLYSCSTACRGKRGGRGEIIGDQS